MSASTWFLLIFFVGSMEVVPVPSKIACDELRNIVLSSYGRAAALVDAKCWNTADSGVGSKK